jgi:hypothetical protein
MTETQTRTFESQPGRRSRVPLLLGITSPSGAGKTYSAARLATGIQRVVGGDIYVLDTENGRSLHYADKFKFQHTPFGAPFDPLGYLAGIEHCVRKGAKTIIIDSASHEHEGPGGVLEIHERECLRLMKEMNQTRDKIQLAAWAKPKQERRRLINTMLQIDCNFILCFRAKKKIKPEKGKGILELGWMPIAGDEWIFEMTMNVLLYPNAGGVPVWEPELPGEREMLKLPEQFRPLMLEKHANKPLSEDIGQALAIWAEGEAAMGTDADYITAAKTIDEATTPAELKKAAEALRTKGWSEEHRAKLAAAMEAAKTRVGSGRAA